MSDTLRTIREVLDDFLISSNGEIIRRVDHAIVGRIDHAELREAIALCKHSICNHGPRPVDRPLGDVRVYFRGTIPPIRQES